MSKKQISTSLAHPVIMYGCLSAQSDSEHEAAARQWELNFTSSLNGEAHDEFCYNEVILLRNVNVRAFTDKIPFAAPIANLPIFHAGVVFLKDGQPTWLYLFEENDDMAEMVDEYPFNDFILDNGERYADAAKKAGIRFGIYDGRETAEYSKEDSHVGYRAFDGGEMRSAEENAALMDQYERSLLVSVPGWPSEGMRDMFYEGSRRFVEQRLGLPEELSEIFGMAQPLVMNPVVYKVPLPGDVEFCIHNIVVSSMLDDTENSRMIVLIQNDHIFEYDLGSFE